MKLKNKTTNPTLTLGLACLLGICWFISAKVRSNAKVNALATASVESEGRAIHDEDRKAWDQDNQTLIKLERERSAKTITPEVLAYLKNPVASVRIRAIRLLGELEDPRADAPLQEILNSLTTAGGMQADPINYEIPPYVVKLALGRIQSRNLKGEARIKSLAESVDLSLSEFIQLSNKVNGPSRTHWTIGSDGDEIVEGIVEILYDMGRKGDDIRPIAQKLTLLPGQQIRLRGAQIPKQDEINEILDHLSKVSIASSDDVRLVQHLFSLQPEATELLFKKLEVMRQNPEQYRAVAPYKFMFRAAVATKDPRVPALLKSFADSPLYYVRNEAKEAQAISEEGGWFFDVLLG